MKSTGRVMVSVGLSTLVGNQSNRVLHEPTHPLFRREFIRDFTPKIFIALAGNPQVNLSLGR